MGKITNFNYLKDQDKITKKNDFEDQDQIAKIKWSWRSSSDHQKEWS